MTQRTNTIHFEVKHNEYSHDVRKMLLKLQNEAKKVWFSDISNPDVEIHMGFQHDKNLYHAGYTVKLSGNTEQVKAFTAKITEQTEKLVKDTEIKSIDVYTSPDMFFPPKWWAAMNG